MNQENHQNDNQKLLLGFILGATAGAAAALVLGPAVNTETREKIAQKTAPLRNLFNNNLDHLLQYGLSALTTYVGKSSAAESSPLKTVVQLLGKVDLTQADKDKSSKKEGKKKRKHDHKGTQ